MERHMRPARRTTRGAPAAAIASAAAAAVAIAVWAGCGGPEVNRRTSRGTTRHDTSTAKAAPAEETAQSPATQAEPVRASVPIGVANEGAPAPAVEPRDDEPFEQRAVIAGAAEYDTSPLKPFPWKPTMPRDARTEKVTAADWVGPDGVIYPNWTWAGIHRGEPGKRVRGIPEVTKVLATIPARLAGRQNGEAFTGAVGVGPRGTRRTGSAPPISQSASCASPPCVRFSAPNIACTGCRTEAT